VPRKSAEARSAAYLRSAGKPLAPPRHLEASVRRVWLSITRSKPPDYFSAASAPLLEALCEAVVMRRFYADLWHRQVFNREDYVKPLVALNSSIAQLSTKLRLAVTSVDKKSGILTEGGDPEPRDGNVVLFGGRRAKF
jgi:hypothetical protein